MKLFLSEWRRDSFKDPAPSSKTAASSSAIRSGISISCGEEALEQLVEEEAAALAWPDALPVALEQPVFFCLEQIFFDDGQRQAAPLLEQHDRKTVDQPQRVEHELERNLARRHD